MSSDHGFSSSQYASSDHIIKSEPRTPESSIASPIDYRHRTPQRSSNPSYRSSSPTSRGRRTYNAGAFSCSLPPGSSWPSSSPYSIIHQDGNVTVKTHNQMGPPPPFPPPWRKADSWRPGTNTRANASGSTANERSSSRFHTDERRSSRDANDTGVPHGGIGSKGVAYLGPVVLGQRAPDDRTLPKNFVPPLTCFYWYTTGRCTKSDDECWYAHYDTGCVAAAPIRVEDREPTAGKQANVTILDAARREEQLRARETDMEARELEFQNKIADLRSSSSAFKEAVSGLYAVMGTVSEASSEARRNLEHSRNALVALDSRSEHEISSMIDVVDRAIGAVAGLSVKLSDVEEHMLANLSALAETEMIGTGNGPATAFPDSGGVPIGSTAEM